MQGHALGKACSKGSAFVQEENSSFSGKEQHASEHTDCILHMTTIPRPRMRPYTRTHTHTHTHTHRYKHLCTQGDGRAWLALCYAGELASTAFAASQGPGIAFTLNALYPSTMSLTLPGIGRNFVSRQLLDAESLEEGMRLLSMPGQVRMWDVIVCACVCTCACAHMCTCTCVRRIVVT